MLNKSSFVAFLAVEYVFPLLYYMKFQFKNTFYLKSLLKQKGITITELHEITGISQNTLSPISNCKSNGIQFNTLDKILEATNSKIEELIEHDEELYSLFIRLEHNNSKKPNFLGCGFKG